VGGWVGCKGSEGGREEGKRAGGREGWGAQACPGSTGEIIPVAPAKGLGWYATTLPPALHRLHLSLPSDFL
jgi:hypothetical protein